MAEAQEKDLAYYLENPDEMPTDADMLDRLMAERDAKEAGGKAEQTGEKDSATPSAETQTTGEDDKAKPQEQQQEADKGKPAEAKETETETKVDGILAKDGKNLLPYAVLEKTRREKTELEDRVRTLQAEITQRNSGDDPNTEEVTFLGEEELDEIENEMPQLSKVLRAQQNVLKNILERESEERKIVEDEERQIAADVNAAVEEAKAANPKIIEWETSNSVRYNKAVEIDEAMRKDPEWKEVPWDKRFAEVVLRTQRFFGDPIETKKQDEPLEDPKDITPDGLGQIPGGTPPANSTRQAMADASVTELEVAFEKMTQEELNAHLARIG